MNYCKYRKNIYLILPFAIVLLARAASVYPILSIVKKLWKKNNHIWNNVKMIGGMKVALTVALVSSISTRKFKDKLDL